LPKFVLLYQSGFEIRAHRKVIDRDSLAARSTKKFNKDEIICVDTDFSEFARNRWKSAVFRVFRSVTRLSRTCESPENGQSCSCRPRHEKPAGIAPGGLNLG